MQASSVDLPSRPPPCIAVGEVEWEDWELSVHFSRYRLAVNGTRRERIAEGLGMPSLKLTD